MVRALSLEVLSIIAQTPQVIGEIAFQGAMDKIVWIYVNRIPPKVANVGAELIQRKVKKTDGQGQEGQESGEYMKEMNDHAVNLIHNLTHSPKTNIFFILDESDIINLINASLPIFDTGDFLKLRQHL